MFSGPKVFWITPSPYRMVLPAGTMILGRSPVAVVTPSLSVRLFTVMASVAVKGPTLAWSVSPSGPVAALAQPLVATTAWRWREGVLR